MKRALAVAVAVVALVGAAHPVRAQEPWVPDPSLDVLPEQLLEPPAPDETQRLLAESQRTKGWCDLLATLDALRPPNPEKVDEIVVFAQAYHQNTLFLDRRAEVDERDDVGRGRKVAVPPPLVAEVERERAAMFAFFARVVATRTLQRQRKIDAAEVQRRVRFASVKLMSSGFSEADAALQRSRARYCR